MCAVQMAFPVDHEHDFVCHVVDIDDDLMMDERAHDALAQAGIRIILLPAFSRPARAENSSRIGADSTRSVPQWRAIRSSIHAPDREPNSMAARARW